MARITVEDCLTRENNRFALVQLASKRTKQLLTGSQLLISGRKGNKSVVNSLREIAAGLVRFKSEEDIRREEAQEEKRRQAELARAEQRARDAEQAFNGAESNAEQTSDEESEEAPSVAASENGSGLA